MGERSGLSFGKSFSIYPNERSEGVLERSSTRDSLACESGLDYPRAKGIPPPPPPPVCFQSVPDRH